MGAGDTDHGDDKEHRHGDSLPKDSSGRSPGSKVDHRGQVHVLKGCGVHSMS